MRDVLFGFFLLTLMVLPVQADEVVVTSVAKPYDVVMLNNDSLLKQYWLGALEGNPIMYGIELTATSSLQFGLRQQLLEEKLPLALIVVRQDDDGGGVTEVARHRPIATDWYEVNDKELGVHFYESLFTTPLVGPGEYRIEVSTPTNQGKYLLIVGQESPQTGYFEVLKNTRTTQRFFGFSIFSMLVSPYVYYPLGIILLVAAIVITWRRRREISHVA